MDDAILQEQLGDVRLLTINRPARRNALDNAAAAALAQALRAADGDAAVRVTVLTGAGGAFCAGADLKALAAGAMYPPWAGDRDGPCHQALAKPLIAAIEGHACAGGLGIALRCDLRVAAAGARFAVLSRRWGVPMSDGTTARLPRLVGLGRALDMLLTAREVEAEEAVAIGLADRLAPRGGALDVALDLARLVAGFPQGAMRADRASAYAGMDLPLADALQVEARISAEARAVEATEGARRFAAGAGRHGAMPGSEGSAT